MKKIKFEEIYKKAVGKTIDGERIVNIELRNDGDIWFLNCKNDGYHIVAQWKHMTKEERDYIMK